MREPEKIIKDLLDLAEEEGVEGGCLIEVYQRAYEEHKARFGSFAPLITKDSGLYECKMEERYEFAFGRVRQFIRNMKNSRKFLGLV